MREGAGEGKEGKGKGYKRRQGQGSKGEQAGRQAGISVGKARIVRQSASGAERSAGRRNRVQGRKKGAVKLSLAFRKHGSLKCSGFEHPRLPNDDDDDDVDVDDDGADDDDDRNYRP